MKILRVTALVAGAVFTGAVLADSGAVRPHNNASATVTVSAESGVSCTADPGDTCSFVVSVGRHHLVAVRHDNDARYELDADVSADGFDLNLSDANF